LDGNDAVSDMRRRLQEYGPTMTVPQLATFLNQSPESIRQKVGRGELPGNRLPGGRNIFFYTDEIAEVLARSRISPADESTEASVPQEEPT
jgi:hypothetical protein